MDPKQLVMKLSRKEERKDKRTREAKHLSEILNIRSMIVDKMTWLFNSHFDKNLLSDLKIEYDLKQNENKTRYVVRFRYGDLYFTQKFFHECGYYTGKINHDDLNIVHVCSFCKREIDSKGIDSLKAIGDFLRKKDGIVHTNCKHTWKVMSKIQEHQYHPLINIYQLDKTGLY